MNEMLLRGCTLKNTGHILGLAVYTGNETRIQKNSAKTPNKIGKSSLAVRLKDACFAFEWYGMPAQLASRNVGSGICEGNREFESLKGAKKPLSCLSARPVSSWGF